MKRLNDSSQIGKLNRPNKATFLLGFMQRSADAQDATGTSETPWRGLVRKILLKTNKGILSLVDQGLLSFTSFATSVLLGRSCSKAELGLYALGLSIMVISTEFQTAFISTPYMVYSPRLEGHDHRQYTGSALIHQLILSMLVSFLLVSGLGVVSLGTGPKGLADVLRVLVSVTFFVMLKEFLRQLCYASLKVKTVLILDSFVTLIQIGGLSLLAFYGVLSAYRSFLVVGAACGLTSVGWLILNRNIFVLNLKKAWSAFRQNWMFIRWLVASHLLWTLVNAFFPWFIAALSGVEANGIWVACIGVATLGNLILVGMQNIVGPRIIHAYAHGGALEMRSLVLKSAMLFVLAMSVFCVFIILFGDMAVVLFYGNKYGGNGMLVSAMALNLVVSSATFPFSRGLFAMERADVDFKINMVSIVMMVLTVYLIRTYGLFGAACGLIASNALSVLLRGGAFSRIAESKIADMREAAA
jgi:O-antigen/teichoic acid export membrane protein